MLLALLLAGCQPPPVVNRENCLPPPLPACSPGSFTETLLDTNYPTQGGIYHQIKLLPHSANTNAHDHAFATVRLNGTRHALITSNRVDAGTDDWRPRIQRLFSSTITGSGIAGFGQAVAVSIPNGPTPFGSAFYHEVDGMIYFAGKAPVVEPNDFDLYVAKPEWNGSEIELTNIRPLTTLNKLDFFDSHPTLSRDGKTLYFSSDRPGGQGGVDIWFSTRSSTSSDSWSTPQPLGSTINTLCDEITPFINAAGKLIFASNGHSTVGGYDLFEAKPLGGGFDIAQNLGKPINTSGDEYFPFAATDSAFYYTSSQRAGLDGANIFVLTRSKVPPPAIANADRPTRQDPIIDERTAAERERLLREPATVHGKITQGNDKTPAQQAEIFVRDNTTQQEIDRDTVGPDGEFSLRLEKGKVYDVGAESGNTFYELRTLDLRRSLDTNIVLDLHLPDTLVLRINFPFDDYSNPYEFVIGDNGEKLEMRWQTSLDLIAQSTKRSLSQLKEMVVIGHTDSMGTEEYNNRLGERRAMFIRDELVKRGVPRRILRIETRGRRQPVEKREEETDEIFRLRSRRAEFVKVFK